MRNLLIIILNLSVLGISAQYTYFNNTYGVIGDQETEAIANVEVVGDTIYLFGGIDDDQSYASFLLRAINNEGNLLIENSVSINYNPEILFIGGSRSVSTINQNSFVYAQTIVNIEGKKGVVTLYNYSLDTIWMKAYNVYSQNTYFRGNTVDESGVIIIGEDPLLDFSSSTMILKIDFDGNIIWSNILHDINEEMAYINDDILTLEDGYLIGGFKQGPFTSMLTKTDLTGNIEWEHYVDNFEDIEGTQASTLPYHLTKLANGDIVGGHMVWYEYYGDTPWNNQDPRWYRSLHINKINVEDSSTYWEHDYFIDNEFNSESLLKLLPTAESGVLAMGYDEYNVLWLAKIDAMGNLEWYKTYEQESFEDIQYQPSDIEQTSDGGYVIVGRIENLFVDDYTISWVMKIDACGDVQWEGCDYVGIQESIKDKQFKIYPNPASQEIQLEGELLTSGNKVQIFDLSSRLVLEETWHQNSVINISTLASGMYQLSVTNDEGTVVGQKLVVE